MCIRDSTQKANDIVRETLTFQGIKTNKELREIYKKRKDSGDKS